MLRYFYAWTPLVIVATVVVLSLPWLGLVALILAAPVALLAVATAIVFAPYLLVRAISRRWQGRSASFHPAPVRSPATHRATFRKGYVS